MLGVLVSPIVFVVLQNGVESIFGRRTLNRAITTSDAVSAVVAKDLSARDEVDRLAGLGDQRVRVLRPDGTVLLDFDHLVGKGLLYDVGDLVYGPDRTAVLRRWDGEQPPLVERVEVKDALVRDTLDGAFHAYGCDHSIPGNLFVCHAAKRVVLPDGATAVVHVQGSSRRALQPIYEGRRQLIKLVVFTLGLGAVLAWWLSRRMVKPVEKLRDEVLARARDAAPRGDLDVQRDDELGDLADAFNALMQALSERSRANEAFLADLAHELKNPVASVRACADRLAEMDDERDRRLADVLRRSSARLDALVTQFLELARAEAGFPDEEREDVDLGALGEGLVTAARDDGRVPAGVELVAKVEDRGACVRGVAHRLESALRNLLDNALSFTDAGDVTLTVRATATDVEVLVEDSGPGISDDDLPRVFDRFFTKRGDGRGSGLGLAMTRAAVEAHGGAVRAEPRAQGRSGARFVVRLPRAS